MAVSRVSRTFETRAALPCSISCSIAESAKTASRKAKVSSGPTLRIAKWSSTICLRDESFRLATVIVEDVAFTELYSGLDHQADYPFPGILYSVLIKSSLECVQSALDTASSSDRNGFLGT